MDLIYAAFQYIGDVAASILYFIQNLDLVFHDVIVYLNAWYIKIKLYFLIYSIKLSYETASLLLEEIGFNTLISSIWNSMDGEIQYYGNLFKIPQGISIITNCMATSLVMRIARL